MRNKIALLVVIAVTLVVGMLLMTQNQTQAQNPNGWDLTQADFAGYCQSVGHADAILWNESADGWVCVNANGLVWHISQIYDGYNSVCVWKTGLLAAYAVNYSGTSAHDWQCAYVEAESDPFPGAPAPEVGLNENAPAPSATAVPAQAPQLSPESLPVVMDPAPPATTGDAQEIFHPDVAPLPSTSGFWQSLRIFALGWW